MADTVEQAFIDTVAPLIDVSGVEHLTDPMRCPEAFLDALAWDHQAETYSEGLLGTDYDRLAIRDAREIRRWIGYDRALDLYAANMGIAYTKTDIVTGTGDTARVTAAEIRVNTLTPKNADETRATKFMNETFDILLGWRIALHGGTVILGAEITFDLDARVFPTQHLHYEI